MCISAEGEMKLLSGKNYFSGKIEILGTDKAARKNGLRTSTRGKKKIIFQRMGRMDNVPLKVLKACFYGATETQR